MPLIIGVPLGPVIDDSGYNLLGTFMGTLKGWGFVTVVLLLGVMGVFAYRHTEMVEKKPHSVTLHWDASANAASYNVYRRTETSEFAKIGNAQTASYVDSNVPNGAVLYYGVTTVAANGKESKISTIIRVEIPKD